MKPSSYAYIVSALFSAHIAIAAPVAAESANTPVQQLSETGRDPAQFPAYVETLKKKARAEGISEATINRAFANIHFVDRAVQADRNQPEKKVLLDDYMKRVVTRQNIDKAREMAGQHRDKLERISKQYGVESKYIVALWATESQFGEIQGKEDTLSALATMAFEGRREAFFTSELMAALEMIDKGKITAGQMKGSWAGAMGQNQFMPSSYLHYGVDGDGDGQVDIWNNLDDVFASTANYLKQEGWKAGESWGREIRLPPDFDKTHAGIESEQGKTINEWNAEGVRQADGKPLPEEASKAWIITPDDGMDRSFLVYPNFHSLRHWNRSWYFAISIGSLADAHDDSDASEDD